MQAETQQPRTRQLRSVQRTDNIDGFPALFQENKPEVAAHQQGCLLFLMGARSAKDAWRNEVCRTL
jgi:hypothetical protein